ncbi:MAG: Fic family protein [Desulfitobacterium hafniense]|nr:Fic family protein [Desulfitobacterium hafniense]
MDYDVEDKIYCYHGSSVLKNKLGIKDLLTLQDAEREIVSVRLAELKLYSPPGIIDLEYLKGIHKHLFQDLFSWAGKLRTVRISKGTLNFAYPEHIESQANGYFQQLERENYLRNTPLDLFCDRLAYYKTEFNMIHPFREGNGRTLRHFIETLALQNGYELNFESNKDRYLEAMIQSPSDMSKLIAFIKDNISKDTGIGN